MDRPGVVARTSSEEVKRRENDTFPVRVRARECRLARQVRRSRPASASRVSLPMVLTFTGFPLIQYNLYVRRANCPCCSGVTYVLAYGRNEHLIDHSPLLHFVLLTAAAAVLLLYCRFLKKKTDLSRPSEHPGGITGCKEKRAPMVLIVTLGQQCSIMSGHVFCGTVHLLMTITKLRSDAGPGCHQLATLTAIYTSLSIILLVGCGSGWCNKASDYPPDRLGD